MADFFRTFFAVIFAILFLVFVPVGVFVVAALFADTGPRPDSWLTIGLEGPLLEHYGPTTLREFFEDPPPCLMEITENLEKAASDERIRGVLFRIEEFSAGPGKIDEIRAGIRAVQEAGKPVYAYASWLLDSGLHLTSACDSTFLFPQGRVFLLGRGATLEHVKGTLEKLGVREQFLATGDYKSAVELFTADTSSAASLANIRWVLEDLEASFDSTIGADRSLEDGALVGLRQRAILRADEAVAEGLVDEALWFDELRDRLRGHHRHWRTISSQEYAKVDRAAAGLGGGAKIAVVHAQGFVAVDGDDRWDGVNGLTMGPDRVVDDLRQVWEDDDVRAVILRWDTGGGSTDGSMRITRAVARARDEKPVVVSIADVAASGGYMMSYPANRIVCPASGITGSIGQLIGKFNVRGLWEKLGVTFDDVALAPNAFLFSPLHDWSEEQLARIAEDNWRTYRDWVEDIAASRGLSFDDVDSVAQGRVWTGRQAAERRLVDATGGFAEALAEARRLADLGEGESVTLVHYPARKSPLELLVEGELDLAVTSHFARVVREALSPGFSARGSLAFQPFRPH
ncbi:MAG: S49 family peptidase [Candidatus Eiseniibacteriota bacterium]